MTELGLKWGGGTPECLKRQLKKSGASFHIRLFILQLHSLISLSIMMLLNTLTLKILHSTALRGWNVGLFVYHWQHLYTNNIDWLSAGSSGPCCCCGGGGGGVWLWFSDVSTPVTAAWAAASRPSSDSFLESLRPGTSHLLPCTPKEKETGSMIKTRHRFAQNIVTYCLEAASLTRQHYK